MSSVVQDLRKKDSAELEQIVVDLKAKLLEQRFAAANGEAVKPHTIKEIKKTIAKALTILNERSLVEENKEAK